MATLADTMVSDMGTVFLNTDEHAVPIVYTVRSTGSTKSVNAIFDPGETVEENSQPDGMGVPLSGTLTIWTDSTSGVLAPASGDSFHVGRTSHPLYNVEYRIEGGTTDGHGAHYLRVFLFDQTKVSKQGFRVDRRA